MTTLGLLSDSHGQAERTRQAVALLLQRGADVLIHLGDIGGEQVIDALAVHHPTTNQQVPAHFVFGNTDGDQQALARYARGLGLELHDPAGLIEVEGMRVGFTHGHLDSVMHEMLNQRVHYLLHGHTHRQADLRRGATRIINPGALHRAAHYSVGLLRPRDGGYQTLNVPDGPAST